MGTWKVEGDEAEAARTSDKTKDDKRITFVCMFTVALADGTHSTAKPAPSLHPWAVCKVKATPPPAPPPPVAGTVACNAG